LTSLHNRHSAFEGHQAFERFKEVEQHNSSTEQPSRRTPSSSSVQVLPPSVDAAIIALCEALDATYMEADDVFVAHVDSRLRSSRRRDQRGWGMTDYTSTTELLVLYHLDLCRQNL
jgi:hypothetical protein